MIIFKMCIYKTDISSIVAMLLLVNIQFTEQACSTCDVVGDYKPLLSYNMSLALWRSNGCRQYARYVHALEIA